MPKPKPGFIIVKAHFSRLICKDKISVNIILGAIPIAIKLDSFHIASL